MARRASTGSGSYYAHVARKAIGPRRQVGSPGRRSAGRNVMATSSPRSHTSVMSGASKSRGPRMGQHNLAAVRRNDSYGKRSTSRGSRL